MNLHIYIYELSAAGAWHPGVSGIRAYPASGRIRYPGVSAAIVKRAFYRRGIIGQRNSLACGFLRYAVRFTDSL